jgi:pimeloyl-ACP methyl ester carboxylesterase
MGVPWAAENIGRLRGVVYTNTVAFPKFRWFGLANLFGSRNGLGKMIASVNMRFIGSFNGAIFRSQFAKQNPQLDSAQIDRFTQEFALNAIALDTTLIHFREITRLEFFDGCDDMLKAISRAVPTEAIWGAGDPYLSDPSLSQQMFARKTSVLPASVGHWVPIIAPDRIAHTIHSFS